MKKLSLDLNSLSVESFVPVATRFGARGTVRAHAVETETCDANFEAYSFDCTADGCTVVATLPPACV